MDDREQLPPPSAAPPAPPAPPQDAPPAYVPPPRRPGHVVGAAVILIVLGVIVSLLGAILLLAGAMFPTIVDMPEFREQLGDVSASAGTLFVVIGFMFLADGVLQVVAGIFVLPGRSWARITGMILAALGILFALVGVLPSEGGSGGIMIVFVIILAAYAYTVWVLATHGRWFTR